MKTITYNKHKYSFPESWNEVYLSQFQQIDEIKVENDLDSELALISVLSGISHEDLLDLPIVEYRKLLELCGFRDNTNDNDKPTDRFIIDDTEYGYRNVISKMTTSEFVD